MVQTHEDIVGVLRGLLSAEQVLTDREALQTRSLDTWPLRRVQAALGAPRELPLCIVRPRSTHQAARIMAELYRRGVVMVPYGGGSGVHGGAMPPKDSVVLDVGEMNRILDLDETNLTVTVQPGVLQRDLEQWLNERGYITGHYPQSIGVAQVGGLVATRSSGQFSTRYGRIEDLVVALEAVTPQGEVVRIRPVPRRAVGPDLRHLWIGSEGTLGLMTEITLKVFPAPPDRWLGAYGMRTMGQGLEAIRAFIREGWRPAVVRLHDPLEASLGYSQHVEDGECILLLLSEGPEGYPQLEGARVDRIVQDHGGRPLGAEPVESWLEHRNDMDHWYRRLASGIIVDTAEVAAPWSTIGQIYDTVVERLKARIPQLTRISGHASHSYPQGTNMYFVFGLDTPRDPEAAEELYWRVWSVIMEATLELGGTICHHHGVGRLRSRWVPEDLGSSYRLLREIKRMLDPKGLMNPGALLPLEAEAEAPA